MFAASDVRDEISEEDEEDEDEVAREAFLTLANLGRQEDSNLPFCVKKSWNRCLLCGFKSKDLQGLLLHRVEKHADPETRICCFCGKRFEDSLTLSLHHMVMLFTKKCDNCFQDLTPTHICSPENLKNCDEKWLSYHCPLGCDLRMKYPTTLDIIQHCRALHGIQEIDVTFDQKEFNTEVILKENVEECSECGILINTKAIPMKQHVIHECHARGKVQKAFVRYIKDQAESQKMDPELMLRLEFESQLFGEVRDEDLEVELKPLRPENQDKADNIISLFLRWSESLNQEMSSLTSNHCDIILKLYSKNLFNPSSDFNFRNRPVPTTYNIASAPDIRILTRLKYELKVVDNVKPIKKESLKPYTKVLGRVIDELESIK